MKKVEIYLLELILFISIIIFSFVYKNMYLIDTSIILIGIYFIIRFGWMKDNNYIRKNVTKTVISCFLAYLVTIYLLGLILGFNKTIFSFNIHYLLKIVLLNAIVIGMEEIIRYIICRNTPHKKLPIVLYALILSILNIIIEINGYDLSNNEVVFIFITTVVLPVISKEAICSYLTYKVSFLPSIVYKEATSLYEYVLPFIPKLGNYLYAVSSIVLPYMVYMGTRKTIHYNDKDKKYQRKVVRQVAYIPILVVLGIVVMLVSGIFSHTIVAIGSNSMSPTYQRGDAIIFKKTQLDQIKIGEILAFRQSGKIITHRIINIQKIDDKFIFSTKGDANKTADAYQVEQENVLGIVKYSVKYIGYPTIWFNDVYARKEINS